jgi:hypothetical protein
MSITSLNPANILTLLVLQTRRKSRKMVGNPTNVEQDREQKTKGKHRILSLCVDTKVQDLPETTLRGNSRVLRRVPQRQRSRLPL